MVLPAPVQVVDISVAVSSEDFVSTGVSLVSSARFIWKNWIYLLQVRVSGWSFGPCLWVFGLMVWCPAAPSSFPRQSTRVKRVRDLAESDGAAVILS